MKFSNEENKYELNDKKIHYKNNKYTACLDVGLVLLASFVYLDDMMNVDKSCNLIAFYDLTIKLKYFHLSCFCYFGFYFVGDAHILIKPTKKKQKKNIFFLKNTNFKMVFQLKCLKMNLCL